jgi:hypothetical protein
MQFSYFVREITGQGCASVGRPVPAGKRNRRLDAPMQMGFYPPVYPPAGRRTEEDR